MINLPESFPKERAEITEAFDTEIKDFSEWFVKKIGGAPLTRIETLILRAYLNYLLSKRGDAT